MQNVAQPAEGSLGRPACPLLICLRYAAVAAAARRTCVAPLRNCRLPAHPCLPACRRHVAVQRL